MKKSGKVTFYAIVKLLLAGFGVLMLLTAAVSAFVFSVFSAISMGVETPAAFSLMTFFWNAGLMCLLLLPMLINIILELLGRETMAWPRKPGVRMASAALLLWPLLFWAGTVIAEEANLAWALLPPLQTILIFLPLLWLVLMGLRLLNLKQTHTEWSVIGVSVLITPAVLIFAEIVLFIFALIVFGIWASSRPELLAELEQFGLRIMNAPVDDPEVLERILMPYLQKPGVITGALFMVSGVIPLIEEFLKPLAMWFLIPRKITPREGFALGLITGAVFALVESLGNLVNPLADMWSVVIIGRMGTALLHSFTSALVGWGIASAWSERKVLRLLLAYLVAVSTHAVWNTFALLLGFGPMVSPSAASVASGLYSTLGTIAPFVLGFLALVMLFLMYWLSRRLGNGSDVQAADIEPPVPPSAPAVPVPVEAESNHD